MYTDIKATVSAAASAVPTGFQYAIPYYETARYSFLYASNRLPTNCTPVGTTTP